MTAPDPRDFIHEAIQAHAPRGEDAVLTGWALVCEWMDHDGERWLSSRDLVAWLTQIAEVALSDQKQDAYRGVRKMIEAHAR